jgi:hypothetical protein
LAAEERLTLENENKLQPLVGAYFILKWAPTAPFPFIKRCYCTNALTAATCQPLARPLKEPYKV